MEKHEFQTESRHLLEMMIHSIYSEKEIFLRELISNASDALDKLNYLSLTGENVSAKRGDMEIRIRIDKEKRILRISDNGIGMSGKELAENLGTIAKSGSEAFREAMKKNSDLKQEGAENLIGQFGVGFYSAFMVADRIAVLSRKYGETEGHRWDSNGIDGYTVRSFEKKTYGTDVILHIRPEVEEGADEFNQFLREYPIYKLIKKYSDYIRYPIKVYMPHPEIKKGSDPKNPEFEEVFSYETVNSMVPLWQRRKSEVTKEEQVAFYKEHFSEQVDPQKIMTADIEGNVSYKALLYIPGRQPENYGSDDYKSGLELYSNSVKVMGNCDELLPEEYNFVRGMVDSPDISLNISREILQKNRQLAAIRTHLTKRIRNELTRLLKNDREEYEKFHTNFGHHLKVCAMDEYGKKKDQLGDLLLFYSLKQDAWITLDEYIEAMKPDQKMIYYANGDNPGQIANIPQIEVVRDHDMDVLCFIDKADQFVAQMFGNYKDKPFRSVVNGDLGLENVSADGQKASDGKTAADGGNASEAHAPLFSFIKEKLGERVDEVKASQRLKSHPVCLTNGSGITFEMERYFRSLSPDMPMKAKYILEINTDHEALKKLDQIRESDPERASKYCEILYQQARLIAGLPVEDASAYTDLLCSLW
ncbi:MAG: molecular chaperone HtpG [Dorea sp.]|nr:molecular chaperone HtpG [Dorea sp.]